MICNADSAGSGHVRGIFADQDGPVDFLGMTATEGGIGFQAGKHALQHGRQKYGLEFLRSLERCRFVCRAASRHTAFSDEGA